MNTCSRRKGDAAVLAKLGDAPVQYREIGERLHAIIRESAPALEPIVRCGLPFYVKDGKDVCYIKPDKHFIAFGFAEVVNPARENGSSMHPVAWTLTSLDDPTEAFARSSRRRCPDLGSDDGFGRDPGPLTAHSSCMGSVAEMHMLAPEASLRADET